MRAKAVYAGPTNSAVVDGQSMFLARRQVEDFR